MSRGAQVVCLVACAALAVLCLASGLARVNEERRAPATLFGWSGFAVGSYPGIVRRALMAQRPEAAESAAVALLAARPMDQTAIAALGSAAVARNNPELAGKAFYVSAQLGWRDPATNLYWAANALASDEPKVAAERTDALLRTGRMPEAAARLLRALEGSIYGRGELAARLALTPLWSRDYVQAVRDLDETGAGQRIAVLVAAHDMGLRLLPQDVAFQSLVLMEQGRAPLALELWQGISGPGRMAQTGFWQPDFAQTERRDSYSPFEWALLPTAASGLDIAAAPGSGAKVLRVSGSGSIVESLTSQWTVLPPGSHRIAWRAETANGTPARSIVARVECASGRILALGPVARDGAWSSASFQVPVSCPGQRVTLLRDPYSGTESEVFVFGARIEPT